MAITDIKRPNYYEGQYLGAADLIAAQEYQRQQDQRHRLAAHTWGIAVGLELEEVDKPGGSNAGDVYIKPGYAVDGFGRAIVVLKPYKLPEALFAQFTFDPLLPQGVWVPVWIRYREEKTNPPAPGFAVCDDGDQAYRILETFRPVVGELSTSQQRDQISVAGKSLDAADEIPDGSVPYQEIPDTGDNAHWLIRLGSVRWLAPNGSGTVGHFVKSTTDDDKKKVVEGRQYLGVVADSVLSPATSLVLCPRIPFADKDAADFASVEGRLRTDGRLVAKKDVLLHGGKLSFQNSSGNDGTAPLWMQRLSTSSGKGTDLRVHIGEEPEPDATPTRLTVGPGPADGSNEKVVLAVNADDTVDISTGALSFGKLKRQMINLWSTGDDHRHGIGVQSNTTYFRSHKEFCWFKGGAHHDDQSAPGFGGSLQLRLDDQARLHFGEEVRQMLNLWKEEYGIGVQTGTLYFRTAADFCWFKGGVHHDDQSKPGVGGSLAMKLDNNNQLDVNGRILRQGQDFSQASTAKHNDTVEPPWGGTDEWNIFVSPKLMGEDEPGSEGDNAILKIECFANPISTTKWKITAQYKFKYSNDPDKTGELKDGEANYLLVPK